MVSLPKAIAPTAPLHTISATIGGRGGKTPQPFLPPLPPIMRDPLRLLHKLVVYIADSPGKLLLIHTSIPSLSRYLRNFNRISYKMDFTLL